MVVSYQYMQMVGYIQSPWWAAMKRYPSSIVHDQGEIGRGEILAYDGISNSEIPIIAVFPQLPFV